MDGLMERLVSVLFFGFVGVGAFFFLRGLRESAGRGGWPFYGKTDYVGWVGEKQAEREINRALRRNETAVLMSDVILPWKSGGSTQIDHLVITEIGIIVIEVKNFSGWIFGNEVNRYWTRTLPDGYTGRSIKNKFYNPVKQNETHINGIRQNLRRYRGPYFSVIAFGDEATCKNLTVTAEHVFVTYVSRLGDLIQHLMDSYAHIITGEQIKILHALLEEAGARADRDGHLEFVERAKSRRDDLKR